MPQGDQLTEDDSAGNYTDEQRPPSLNVQNVDQAIQSSMPYAQQQITVIAQAQKIIDRDEMKVAPVASTLGQA